MCSYKYLTFLSLQLVFANIAIGITKVANELKWGVLQFRVGPFRNMVAVFDAKAAEAILSDTKTIVKPAEYDFLKPWLGEGLLTG